MDHQAIESRLRGRPSDTAAWADYAEWLSQRGDPRGKFIRLAQQISRLSVSSLRHAALSQELDLLGKECGPLVKDIPPAARAEWQHGFVTGLQLELTEDTATQLRPFLSSPDACLLRSLRFTSRGADPDEDEEEFDERESVNTPPDAKLAGAAAALAELDLRNIRVLAMPYCLIGEKGAIRLLSSPHMGPLLSLDLRYAYIADAGIARLAKLPHLFGLRSLWLQRNGITTKGAQALAASPHLRELRLLDLRYNPIGPKGVEALAKSDVVRELKVLQILRSEAKKVGAKALAESANLPLALRRMWRAP